MVFLDGGLRFLGHFQDGMKTGYGILERPEPWVEEDVAVFIYVVQYYKVMPFFDTMFLIVCFIMLLYVLMVF